MAATTIMESPVYNAREDYNHIHANLRATVVQGILPKIYQGT